MRGSDIFLKGILSADKNILKSTDVAIYVDISSKSLRGVDINKYEGKAIYIGVGKSVLSRDEIFRLTEGLAVKVNNREYGDSPPLNELSSKYFYVQNYPSIIVAHTLDPKESIFKYFVDETILDMCCAPGGKTTHIGYLSNNKSTIIAIDKSTKKIDNEVIPFKNNWKLDNIIPFHYDSTKLIYNMKKINQQTINKDKTSNVKYKKAIWKIEKLKRKNEELKSKGKLPIEIPDIDTIIESFKSKDKEIKNNYSFPDELLSSCDDKVKQILLPLKRDSSLNFYGFYPESFDKILLDPPCSALGLRPRLLCDTTLKELKKYSDTQKDLFKIAYSLCKRNGIIVYSTCTINPMENEDNVKYFLDNCHIELLNQDYKIGNNGYDNCSLSNEDKKYFLLIIFRKVQRFNPFDSQDTIGFFIAKFRKL